MRLRWRREPCLLLLRPCASTCAAVLTELVLEGVVFCPRCGAALSPTMACTNVASCVISIVGSFSNGADVFRRLRDKRRRRKRNKRADELDEKELRLSRSLRQGPEDIGREYQRNVYGAGADFEVGDGMYDMKSCRA